MKKIIFAFMIFGILGGVLISFGHWTTPVAEAESSRIAYWKLDESSGPTYADEEGVHDGSCTNCPAATSGQINGGQGFDGSNDGIDVPANAAFDWGGGDSFSIEFWMQGNPGQTCAAGNEVMVGRGSAGGAHWSLGCTGTSGTARFELSDGSNSLTLESGKAINNGAWHHISGLYDGGSDEVYLYVDGADASSGSQTFSNDFASGADDLNLGHLNGSDYFEGTLDEVAVYSLVLPVTELRSHYYLGRGYADSCTAPVSIMPLGDSITLGYSSGVDDDDKMVAYRKDLWHSLTNNGYDVDFVGNLINGEYYQPLEGFDPDHEGRSGWRDDEIASNVFTWLTSTPAEVVLLHIGTNALNTDPGDVEDILDQIDLYDENITVILARIVNRQCSTDNPPCNGAGTTTAFNNNVEAMATSRIVEGDKIIIVDMENGAGINYQYQPAGDMWNNLHPYATGYTKMAGLWFDTLDDFLPVCEFAPTFTSIPVTTAVINQPYTYDADASGNPAPTYTLTTAPAGMTIDPVTGVINWTPFSVGIFNVEVMATNSAGNDTQPYTISVTGPPPTPQCIDPDRVGYWKLDDAAGSTTFLDSADSHDGSCSQPNCPTATTGLVNGAFSFDNSDRINVPDANDFDWSNTDSFSIELWMNTSQACSSTNVFTGKYQGPVSWWLGCDNNGPYFSLRDSNGNLTEIDDPTVAINDGNWHHIVAVRNGGAAQNSLYLDGVQVASTGASYTGNFITTVPLNIGYFDVSPFYYYDGLLDEIAIYQRALSAGEIQQHYNNGLVGYGYDYNTIWLGADADWQTAVNWSNGVPVSTDRVYVPGGSAQLSADGAVACLQVASGATVDLGTNDLTIEDTLANEGTLQQTQLNVDNTSAQFLHLTNAAADTIKYRGVEITTTVNLGDVTAVVRAIDPNEGEACTTDPSSPAYANRCYTITAENPNNNAVVKLWARDDERNAISYSNLTPYHFDAITGNWVPLIPVDFSPAPNSDGYVYAQGTTTSFSSFLLGGSPGPTIVSLRQFHVSSTASSMLPVVITLLVIGLIFLKLNHFLKNK